MMERRWRQTRDATKPMLFTGKSGRGDRGWGIKPWVGRNYPWKHAELRAFQTAEWTLVGQGSYLRLYFRVLNASLGKPFFAKLMTEYDRFFLKVSL